MNTTSRCEIEWAQNSYYIRSGLTGSIIEEIKAVSVSTHVGADAYEYTHPFG